MPRVTPTLVRTAKGNLIHYSIDGVTTLCGREAFGPFAPPNGMVVGANCHTCSRKGR